MNLCNGKEEESIKETDQSQVTMEQPGNAPETEGETANASNGTTETVVQILNVNEISMLERLAHNPNAMVKSQQRDEPDMSSEEKLKVLKAAYCTCPVQFLAKFGRYMQATDAVCFEKLKADGNYEVLFQLKEIEKFRDEGYRQKLLKNRRYEALKKLVETTDYFSEEEMQRRNPLLFDQLIGKYHTEEERQAFLQQSWKSTSGSGTTAMPLTDMFLAHLNRTSEGISCRRMAQESQQEEEDAADAEYDSEEEDDYDMSPKPGSSKSSSSPMRKQPTVNDESQREEIEDEEKELLKEEFFTTMYRNFLNGKDEDFDYSTVDDNPEYDCGENLDNDEEEKYFDDEEPCEVSEPSSDQDELFKPPVRSSEIESKIEKLSVNQTVHSQDTTTNVEISSMSEDEDELDAYMREIEKQLQT